MTQPRPLVAVIMHNATERLLYGDVLAASGVDVLRLASGASNCEALLATCPDAVLLDLDNGAAESLAILARMRTTHGKAVSVVGVTASPTLADQARHAGCDDCLVLPVANADLVNRIHHVLRSARPADRIPLRKTA